MATATSSRSTLLGTVHRAGEFLLPVGVVAGVLVILVPLPTGLMNLLLAANITVAVIILLTTIHVKTPLEFSIFPSLLLATTLSRLVLNVATTRLILTKTPADGLEAAGGVVRAFGQFVAGDQVVVGLVIFLILVVIQFVVITKGATRISEVAARFALDAMPGRQMAIDADLNAGLINEQEARNRRDAVAAQADFYGAMDGASKFVRGDAIAGILITLTNIVGGLCIGIFQFGMSPTEAGDLFTKLTIGDGLVSQVPALLISLAAGLLVTRSTRATNLPNEFVRQLFGRPQVLAVAGVFVCVLVLTDLPRVPLLLIGLSCVGLAVILSRRERQAEQQAETARRQAESVRPETRVEDYLANDPIEFELGIGLLRLAGRERGGDLLGCIQAVRRDMAGQLGIILPKVRLRDNLQLARNEYRIKLSGVVVASGHVAPDRFLALDTGKTTARITGIPTVDPASGAPALWIEPETCDEAKYHGYTVAAPSTVLANHLSAVARDYADELLTRDATKHLVDELRRSSPAVVDELIPELMKLADVQQVLQMLLAERVSIRPLATILESLGHHATHTQNSAELVEHVRSRLARTLSAAHCDEEGCLRVVTLDPALEDRIAESLDAAELGASTRMTPQEIEHLCGSIAERVESLASCGYPPVVLVDPRVRPAVRRLTAAAMPKLVVLSYDEITRDTRIESVGMVDDAAGAVLPFDREMAPSFNYSAVSKNQSGRAA